MVSLEEIERIVGFVAGLEEGDTHLADADRFMHSLLPFAADGVP